MMKEWATVVSWQQGVALLRCEPKAGCGSCTARSGCGARALNELVPETEHQLQVRIEQPLEPGQRVEVGIAEGSLLRSAMLVYLTPLLGMMLGGSVLQYWLGTDVQPRLAHCLVAARPLYWRAAWRIASASKPITNPSFCKLVYRLGLCACKRTTNLCVKTAAASSPGYGRRGCGCRSCAPTVP